MQRNLRSLALLVVALLALDSAIAPCRADVTVSPTLVLFDGETGTKAITVKKTGAKEQVYPVPLIIRQGNPSVAVSFGDAHLTSLPDGAPAVALRVERSGERSIRGALSLRGNGKQVALIDGLSIYAPTPYRDVLLRVAAEDAAQLDDGRLEAWFDEPEEVRNPVAAHAVIHLR